jgi:hypothetical protein
MILLTGNLPEILPNASIQFVEESSSGTYAQPSNSGYPGVDTLHVLGVFQPGSRYHLSVRCITGAELLSCDFTASGDRRQFHTGRCLSAGVYLIHMTSLDAARSRVIFKVVKQ